MMQVNDFNVSYAESNGDGDDPNMSFVKSIYSANAEDHLQSKIDKRSVVLGSFILKEDSDH